MAWQVLSVARAAGIDEDQLSHAAVEETMAATNAEYMKDPEGKRVPPPYKPSMLVDLEHGRPMEVEVIVGSIVRSGSELGVPTPQYVISKRKQFTSRKLIQSTCFRLDVVYASLRVMQAGLLRLRRDHQT